MQNHQRYAKWLSLPFFTFDLWEACERCATLEWGHLQQRRAFTASSTALEAGRLQRHTLVRPWPLQAHCISSWPLAKAEAKAEARGNAKADGKAEAEAGAKVKAKANQNQMQKQKGQANAKTVAKEEAKANAKAKTRPDIKIKINIKINK